MALLATLKSQTGSYEVRFANGAKTFRAGVLTEVSKEEARFLRVVDAFRVIDAEDTEDTEIAEPVVPAQVTGAIKKN